MSAQRRARYEAAFVTEPLHIGRPFINCNYQGLFNADEIAHARKLIDYFYEKFRILKQDGIEDLLQECLTHWYFNRHKHDETKTASWKTYMSHVFENKIMDIIEKKRSQKRKAAYDNLSLDDLLEHTDQEACGSHPVSDDESFKETFKSDTNDVLLRALERLSLRQRELCRLIQIDGLNLKQASKKLNIPRTTLYEDVYRIREIFRQEGLKDYL